MDAYELKPKMWFRYVDDTFVIRLHGKEGINGFLQHLDGLRDSIKFTMGLAVDGKIAFLDVLIHEQPNVTLRTMVYKKRVPGKTTPPFRSNYP
ncbi:hypothetical protein Trydic_g22684 [Trypoxylus dichotomus]